MRMSPLRRAVERRSGPVLVLLSRQHRAVVPVLSAVLLLLGLFLPPPAGLPFLLVLLAFIGWLTYLSWPVLLPGARAVRCAVVALLTIAVATHL